MRYNAESYSSLKNNTQYYKGINGENPPVRILTPQNDRERVELYFQVHHQLEKIILKC